MPPSTPCAALALATATTIVVNVEPFGFAVEVLPPPAGVGHDAEFNCLTPAREYANRLHLAHGWQLIDLTAS